MISPPSRHRSVTLSPASPIPVMGVSAAAAREWNQHCWSKNSREAGLAETGPGLSRSRTRRLWDRAFFSDQAFRFYLAAYLLADLRGELQQANVVFALTHGLDRASRDKKINPRRYGERTWFEHARDKFAMFSAPEYRRLSRT
jgi:hypothetical protein